MENIDDKTTSKRNPKPNNVAPYTFCSLSHYFVWFSFICYGTGNSIFILFALKLIFLFFFFTPPCSYPYVQWLMYWRDLSLSCLWDCLGWAYFTPCFGFPVAFTCSLYSLAAYAIWENSFIWTYLCRNKVEHNHLLLNFCIFSKFYMWALTYICLMVPFCQRLHIRTYFIVLSSYLGSQYSLSLWHFLGWLCRICAVHLLAIPLFGSFCAVKPWFLFLHSFFPLIRSVNQFSSQFHL